MEPHRRRAGPDGGADGRKAPAHPRAAPDPDGIAGRRHHQAPAPVRGCRIRPDHGPHHRPAGEGAADTGRDRQGDLGHRRAVEPRTDAGLFAPRPSLAGFGRHGAVPHAALLSEGLGGDDRGIPVRQRPTQRSGRRRSAPRGAADAAEGHIPGADGTRRHLGRRWRAVDAARRARGSLRLGGQIPVGGFRGGIRPALGYRRSGRSQADRKGIDQRRRAPRAAPNRRGPEPRRERRRAEPRNGERAVWRPAPPEHIPAGALRQVSLCLLHPLRPAPGAHRTLPADRTG